MILPNIAQDKIGSLEVCLDNKVPARWNLLIEGEQWNCWHMFNNSEVQQLIPSVENAYGKVIATGLGFCLRESMLLYSQNVEEIVVLENNPDVIKYQMKHNPQIMDKIEVIECDANEYEGECDVLLLDHYEIYNQKHIENFKECRDKTTKNIKHNLVWWWGLEQMTQNFAAYVELAKDYELPHISPDYFFAIRDRYYRSFVREYKI